MRLSFLTIVLVAFGISAQAQTDTLRIRTSAVCDMCKKTIEEGMAFTKGVKFASLDVETKLLTVAINPKKTDAFVYTGVGLTVVEQVPIIAPPHACRSNYMAAKRSKMGHLLPDDVTAVPNNKTQPDDHLNSTATVR